MTEDFWETNAERWAEVIESRSIASRALTNQAIIDQIVLGGFRSVLDIGCGEGWIASELKPRGIEYLGIDGSENLIKIARSKHAADFERVSYADIVSGWTPQKLVDVAVFNFSLLDENLVPIFKSVAGFLNPRGEILIQTLHPFFVLKPYQDGWKTEDFKSMSIPFEGTMPWFGRTVSSWSRVFEQSGLRIKSLVEPSGDSGPVSLIFRLGSH